MTKTKLILASASAARKTIIKALSVPFSIIESKVDEDKIFYKNPKKLVLERARIKGETVEKIVLKSKDKNACLLAADSMVVLNNICYGKAKTKPMQKKYLRLLSGKTHQFLTGIWFKNLKTGKIRQDVGISEVTIKKLTEEEIDWYVKSDDLSKYAGAYSLYNSPQFFITEIKGSITNVVGLPLEILIPLFHANSLL